MINHYNLFDIYNFGFLNLWYYIEKNKNKK